MLIFMAVLFIILLVISTPVAIVLLGVTTATVHFYLHVPLQAMVQQLFNGMDNFILLSIPFFKRASPSATRLRCVAIFIRRNASPQ